MAFADPQSVTINAVAQTLPRISSDGSVSVYQKDDGTVRLTASHKNGNRNRHTIRLDHSKISVDPFVGTQNIEVGMSINCVVDVPRWGYTVAEAKQVCDALWAYMTATSGAQTTKLLGGEN
jgi:hypothetical protein